MPEANVFNPGTSQWVNAAAISNPAGGATVDTEGRAAANSILAALRNAGVIAGATQQNLGHTFNAATSQVVLGAAINSPTGGATTDANCRTTINAALAVLRSAGIIAGGTAAPASPVFDEDESKWAVAAAVADVAAGGTVDAECRAAVNAALAAMRKRGLIAAD